MGVVKVMGFWAVVVAAGGAAFLLTRLLETSLPVVSTASERVVFCGASRSLTELSKERDLILCPRKDFLQERLQAEHARKVLS